MMLFVLALLTATNIEAAQDVRWEPYEYDYQWRRIHAELGRLSVPERYDNPRDRSVILAFVRLRSTSPNPGPPIVYLAGGPGGAGINLAKGPRGAVFLAMRNAGNVIALDQRGVGLSEPNLDCPGGLGFSLSVPGDLKPMLARVQETARSCASHWRGRGDDLAAYNVVESAHDLDALREALGAEKIRLWGSSYGTFLALAAIRHHGAHIQRAVLAGVEGPDHTLKLPSTADRQLRTLAKLVAGDPRLSHAIPDFMSLVSRVLGAAERSPFIIPVRDAKSETAAKVTLGRFDLEQFVIAMIGDRSGLERLPRTLLDIDSRRFTSPLVQDLARAAVQPRTGSIGSAMAYASDCASGASSERHSRIEREVRSGMLAHLDFPIPEVCSAWGVPELPARERTQVQSSVPVLFISGTLDGRTPPENAEEVRKGFPNSTHVLIEASGHGNDLFVSSPEIEKLMVELMKTTTVTTRHIQLPPLRFE